MSTRVHELAKELGLKSPELLDRIQKAGLDVKASALAVVEPAMVDRIRQMIQGSATGSAPAAGTKPPAPAPARPATPTPQEKPAISATAPPESRPASTGSAASRPATTPPRAVPQATAAPVATPRPAAPTPTPQASNPPATPPAQASGFQSGPATGRLAATDSPVSRPGSGAGGGGLSAPPRSGPLSSHTSPARSGPLSRTQPPASAPDASGPERPASNPARAEGGASTPAPAAPGPRANPTTPPPLKRSDYISPTGTRTAPTNARPPMTSTGSAPVRRSSDTDGGRRESAGPPRPAGRPLPPVASGMNTAPPPRRPDGPRPSGPEVKSQRPDVKFTPAQLMEMRRTGQLDAGGPPAAPARPGMAPNRPGMAPNRPGLGPNRPALGPGGGAAGPGAQARGPMGPGGLRRPPAPGGPPGIGSAPGGLIAPPPVSEEEDEKGKGKAGGRLGSAADRAGRRAKRNERSADRRGISSPVPVSAITSEDDDGRGRNRGPRRGGKGHHRSALAPVRKTHAEIEPPISVRTLSEAIGIQATQIIRKFMNMRNELITINAALDEDTAIELALEFGIELEIVYERTAEDDLYDAVDLESDAENMILRPPIITILGHVDHGKTSLLDKIRKANVVATESGGITQHIGAYQIEHEGKKIAFVDTPGHEAFTAMRARGANVTDIVILVVAADDGVMPQTREAIAHAKAAEVPVVVALNKIDLPSADTPANINKIYGELSQEGLIPEEYGGDTPVVKTSTFTGQGLSDLLATLDAIAELNELKADPARNATGTCLEASKSEGRGVVATVMVQDGTLRVGDIMVCGDGFGKVRALFDDKGRSIQEAGPSTPVEISGLDEVPTAGEKFYVLEDVSRAREIAESRRLRTRGIHLGERQTVTLENLYSSIAQQKLKSLNLILKADVQGSLEALVKELDKLENPEVPIRILLKAVGGIGESDVLLADASEAIIVGFRVAPDDKAMSLADEKKIDIRRYDIIYQVTDEVKKAVEGMLIPEVKEVHLGRAVVRMVYKISKVGAVAGCFVTQGTIERSAKARIIREGREIYKGSIDALKRFKDDVKEVAQDYECGIKLSNFDDVKSDDVIEAYRIDIIRRTL